jgi:ubiquinone biosynthesis protein Coq4
VKLNLKERLQSLTMVAGLATFLKNPGSLGSVFAVAGSLKDRPLGAQMMQDLLADSCFKALVDESWRPQPIDLQQLQTLPEGSLGPCYADQLVSPNITPDTLIDPSPVINPRSTWCTG